MRRTLLVVSMMVLVFPPLCDSSIGILPLVGLGAVGLKVYVGMHLLGGGATLFRNSLLKFPLLGGDDDDDDNDDDVDGKDDDSKPTTRKPKRARPRSVSSEGPFALPKLNAEILTFIHQIDDDQCFEKFLCQLGADQKAFGSFGMNVALMLQFYSSDRHAWYTKATQEGRKLGEKELCPGRCESEDIQKVVKYVSKELFPNS